MRLSFNALFVSWLAIAVVAADPARADVAHWLAELGAPTWMAREEASRQLLALGPGALVALEARSADPDPEIAWRAQRIAARIIDDGPPALAAERILAAPENAWMPDAWRMVVGQRVRGDVFDPEHLAAAGVAVELKVALEEIEDREPVRLGHRALGRVFARVVLREPLRWNHRIERDLVGTFRRDRPVWPRLLQDAAIGGSLRGQALEDAYAVLQTVGGPEGSPLELDEVGDPHGARTVVALVAALAGKRSTGELATSWDDAIGLVSRQEAQTSFARRLRSLLQRECLRKVAELRALEEGLCPLEEAVTRPGEGAAELALMAVGHELRDALRYADGCLADPPPTDDEPVRHDGGPVAIVLARMAERVDLSGTERAHLRALARRCTSPRDGYKRSIEVAALDQWRATANRYFGEERSLDALREVLALALIRDSADERHREPTYDKRPR